MQVYTTRIFKTGGKKPCHGSCKYLTCLTVDHQHRCHSPSMCIPGHKYVCTCTIRWHYCSSFLKFSSKCPSSSCTHHRTFLPDPWLIRELRDCTWAFELTCTSSFVEMMSIFAEGSDIIFTPFSCYHWIVKCCLCYWSSWHTSSCKKFVLADNFDQT